MSYSVSMIAPEYVVPGTGTMKISLALSWGFWDPKPTAGSYYKFFANNVLFATEEITGLAETTTRSVSGDYEVPVPPSLVFGEVFDLKVVAYYNAILDSAMASTESEVTSQSAEWIVENEGTEDPEDGGSDSTSGDDDDGFDWSWEGVGAWIKEHAALVTAAILATAVMIHIVGSKGLDWGALLLMSILTMVGYVLAVWDDGKYAKYAVGAFGASVVFSGVTVYLSRSGFSFASSIMKLAGAAPGSGSFGVL